MCKYTSKDVLLAKKYAEKAFELGLYEISFDYNDQAINNPWIDPTGRFDLTDEEAIKIYGKDNIETYIEAVNNHD